MDESKALLSALAMRKKIVKQQKKTKILNDLSLIYDQTVNVTIGRPRQKYTNRDIYRYNKMLENSFNKIIELEKLSGNAHFKDPRNGLILQARTALESAIKNAEAAIGIMVELHSLPSIVDVIKYILVLIDFDIENYKQYSTATEIVEVVFIPVFSKHLKKPSLTSTEKQRLITRTEQAMIELKKNVKDSMA